MIHRVLVLADVRGHLSQDAESERGSIATLAGGREEMEVHIRSSGVISSSFRKIFFPQMMVFEGELEYYEKTNRCTLTSLSPAWPNKFLTIPLNHQRLGNSSTPTTRVLLSAKRIKRY